MSEADPGSRSSEEQNLTRARLLAARFGLGGGGCRPGPRSNDEFDGNRGKAAVSILRGRQSDACGEERSRGRGSLDRVRREDPGRASDSRNADLESELLNRAEMVDDDQEEEPEEEAEEEVSNDVRLARALEELAQAVLPWPSLDNLVGAGNTS